MVTLAPVMPGHGPFAAPVAVVNDVRLVWVSNPYSRLVHAPVVVEVSSTAVRRPSRS
ncbi:Uncharacterised protein [Cellulomonas fimi]|nr:Uncharacterised protein [Cellulomonas fimi]